MSLGLLCCLLGACAYKVVHGGQLSPAAMERLLASVERIRGLKATEPLRVTLEGAHRLKARSTTDLHRPSYLHAMEDLSMAWAKVGLVPPGADLAAAYSSVGSEAPAGYYDTGDRVLRIVSRQNPRSEILEVAGLIKQRDLMDGEILAHEVAHALQDMHFDLERFLNGVPNDDSALARRCLAEGDASFVGYAYSSVFTRSMETWIRFLEDRQGALDVASAPDFVNRRFQLPYLAGARFVAALHRKGGWNAVNAAYLDPPASTEEILHPAKYLKGRDRPVDVRLPSLLSVLGEGYREIWQDSVGELGLRTVLARERPGAHLDDKPHPRVAAEGWDGDRAAVYQRNGHLVLAWKLVFDDEKEAQEGYQAYRQMMGRYPGLHVIAETPLLLEGRTGSVGAWMERRGTTVVVLEGVAPERQREASALVFAEPLGHAFDPPGLDAGFQDAGGTDAGSDASGADGMDAGRGDR